MSLSEFYIPKLYEAYFNNTIFTYVRQQYHLLTSDHDEKYFYHSDDPTRDSWCDRWVSNYKKYKDTKIWEEHDSVVNGAADTLEEMLK